MRQGEAAACQGHGFHTRAAFTHGRDSDTGGVRHSGCESQARRPSLKPTKWSNTGEAALPVSGRQREGRGSSPLSRPCPGPVPALICRYIGLSTRAHAREIHCLASIRKFGIRKLFIRCRYNQLSTRAHAEMPPAGRCLAGRPAPLRPPSSARPPAPARARERARRAGGRGRRSGSTTGRSGPCCTRSCRRRAP